jgi:hypothetical protein
MGAVDPVKVDPDRNAFDHHAAIQTAYPECEDAEGLHAAIATQPHHKPAFQRIFEAAMARWGHGEHDRKLGTVPSARGADLAQTGQSAPEQPQRRGFHLGRAIAAAIQQLLQVPVVQSIALNWSLVNAGFTRWLTGKVTAPVQPQCPHTPPGHAHPVTYR